MPRLFFAHVIVSLILIGSIDGWKHDPEEDMDAYQLISTKGYPVETHEVVTEDGYRLGLFRIPPKPNSDPHNPTPPIVFLQHGLLMSCTCWLTNLKNQSFAYLLADQGFDVWLGNFRGSTYSRNHAWLNTNSAQYWKFSWDEMAQYDLPTMIDYALEISGGKDLYYIGHSEGTLTAFAQFSQDQVFAKKVKQFFALAPVYYVHHCSGLVKIIGSHTTVISWVLKAIGYNEFLPKSFLNKILAKLVCGSAWTDPLCENALFLITGYDRSGLNETRIPVYLSHTPAGTSTRNMVHFGQMVQENSCRRYDHGSAWANKRVYGQEKPPAYNVEKMKVPVSLYWGDNDWLADPADIAQLITQLPNVQENVWIRGADHIEFVWGEGAPKTIYQPIIRTILQDSQNPQGVLGRNKC